MLTILMLHMRIENFVQWKTQSNEDKPDEVIDDETSRSNIKASCAGYGPTSSKEECYHGVRPLNLLFGVRLP